MLAVCIHGDDAPRAGEILRNYSPVEKARERIGFAPAVSPEDGLRRTYEWFWRLRATEH